MKGCWLLLLLHGYGCLPCVAEGLLPGWGTSRHNQPCVPSFRRRPGLDTTTTFSILRLCGGGNNGSDDDDEEGPLTPMTIEPEDAPPTRVLIVMDGFCDYHGVYLMRHAHTDHPGTVIVPVLSDYMRRLLLQTEPDSREKWQALRMPHTPAEALEWKRQLPCPTIAAIYCESDSGLEDAERLRELLQVSCRDEPTVLSARRHKAQMNEYAARCGLQTARQQLCFSRDEARAFATTLWAESSSSGPVIVKPFRGVASESVHLCATLAEVDAAWDSITSSSVFGERAQHESVLVQEFLQGTEYALDVVSCAGEHKIAAVWRYDKRPANGAPFCYFQTRLVDATMEPTVFPAVCKYVREALTALGVRYGLSHNEVIVTADRGPVLVEVNCRQHNMDFVPITEGCIGYNALDMTLEALLNNDDGDGISAGSNWDLYPSEPVLRAHGCMVHLVNFVSGVLKEVHHMDTIAALPSFLTGEIYEGFQTPASEIEKTIDIRTDAGWIQLVAKEREDLESDYNEIVDLMPTMFEVE